MVYSRFAADERYIILINPSGNVVKASLTNLNSKQAHYIFGTSRKSSYKVGIGADAITVPAVSAAIYKLD